jgi:hypothetical protein
VVMADGTVLLVYEDNDTRGVKARYRPRFYSLRSTDGGRTLTESAPVNTKWWHDTIRSSANEIEPVSPRLAADPGSLQFADRVYCVWPDGNNSEGMRIFFCASLDAGATWAQPVVISEQPMQGGAEGEYITFMPSIAVNNDGAVAVSWYDRRGLQKSKLVPTAFDSRGRVSAFNLEANGWNVRLRASLDGGATWLPSVQVNEEPGQGRIEVGHTAGLAAGADGRFHAAWIDNRTGKCQLWTAAIEVKSEK